MYKKASIITFVLLIIVLLSAATLYLKNFLLHPAGENKNEEIFVVKRGSGLKEIAEQLEKRGLIKNKFLFIALVTVKGEARNIKAGEYSLNRAMTPIKICNILASGSVKTHSFTIPEGFTAEQIAETLDRKNLLEKKSFISLVNDKNLLTHYRIEGPSLEGYLFPDTYTISRDLRPVDFVDLMVRRFWHVFNRVIQAQDFETGQAMSTKDIVTLASIVEKETGLAEERPLIASVFLNRLKKGLRLESDPTVIYGLKEFDGNLTTINLQTPTPYNTYIIYGLPPGPISNPGRDSLMAVIKPTKTNYLYFVSKNNGSHHFSETLSEHNRAVSKYQKRFQTTHKKKSNRALN